MSRVVLISSGAYIEPELEAEFGRLPPSFLPLGNRRLFVHQRALFTDPSDRLLLSLPETFEPDPGDYRLLAELGIEVVKVPDDLTLGQSLVYVVNVTATAGTPLAVMHGDTLLEGLPLGGDLVTTSSEAPPGYPWGYVRDGAEGLEAPVPESTPGARALTGYFSFADTSLFVQAITRAKGAFLPGLENYARTRPIAQAEARRWLDFGHASTYHLSRQAVTTEREFNRLTTERRSVRKSGEEIKIRAEAAWFETLPGKLRVFTPAFLGPTEDEGRFAYSLEYLHLPSLSDLLVFGRLTERAWTRILDACDEFMVSCAAVEAPPAPTMVADIEWLLRGKTMERLERFAKQSGFDIHAPLSLNGRAAPSLVSIAERVADAVPAISAEDYGLTHGDFCFSNILYDFRSQRVKVIDPRGLAANGRISAYGDRRYDVAKLHHSVVGLYDFIVSGSAAMQRPEAFAFELDLPDQPWLRAAQRAFSDHPFVGKKPRDQAADAISVLLFLSMLPLHSDRPERQLTLAANAVRLFQAL